ncbi:ABC transporter permease [Lentzea tibetensis]|uniref:ABC transporter permease n=1 Tax=Lentzea tibetensis TaxID=2591470 RepID=UPI00164821BE|nr:ABC transporter permease [Lentzea tibetensis]
MLNAIRFEFIRLRTLRSTWFLLSGSLALQFVVALMYAGQDELTGRERFVFSFTGISLLLVTLLPTAVAVASFGHEYRYGTITTTVLTLRGTAKVLAAKALTVAAMAACTGLGLIGVTLLVDVLHGSTPEMWRVGQVLVAVVIFTTLSGLVGLGMAATTRNATVAVVTVLGFPTIIETLIVVGTKINTGLLPFNSAMQMVKLQEGGNPWLLPLPLAALAVVLLGTGGTLLARRDI